ncbi:MAG: amino acid permease [Clostridium sp.]|jgi:AAT family amino acid transporter|uniref:amino acid permease n=1 Tax=Clostridium sp. TaxID=1506 RepID=UPI0025BE7685|nr:amino acid permease [Clostridium sp.]MCH3963481.1 amino acid permease [Clostridium sp.]MCI1714622.1 amino acid permease [Clostridium sp.]MCI1799189.1 amino acid permease [Clostridium sp.]MCI1812805.1 amino acid permease [Clostridium sp.]MCI1869695.1 amino acid permease [Clostridium sp.]
MGGYKLKRNLKNRHIQMIAIGGAIGVGLFYGSADAISMGGPSIILAYLTGGLFVFIIMRALGELSVDDPNSGSFSAYATKYLGDFAGFFSGWTYWLQGVTTVMAELTAVGIYVQFWLPDFPRWISALVFLLVLVLINIIGVKAYGEFEFWLALIKVVCIICMIIFGLFMIVFGFGNKGHAIGFSNLWMNGGFFPNGIRGFLLSFIFVTFAFGGVELIGITAGEAENPEKSIPKAINNVFWRILIFYVGSMLVMLSLYSWSKIGIKGSPFVLVFDKVGIPAAASIINFVVLTAALSGMNSALFVEGRMLYSLALNNNAPGIFRKISKSGIPYVGILFSTAIAMIAIFLNYLLPFKVFNYISSVTVIAIITAWITILLVQLKFRKYKSSLGQKVKFKMPFYPVLTYTAIIYLLLIVALLFVLPSTRISIYVVPVWIAILLTMYKILIKNR